ncbi:hypothetical protein CO130_00270 [Candidatus Jorgensenbacteria bacterium CG_4_9_14_3_um_filter_38_10]|nr:MAG: hypothetical protein CO130_00270 [Candidatus Jorgensenbacteria bacterium CG_4_9_14_3_um_filter_38_10]
MVWMSVFAKLHVQERSICDWDIGVVFNVSPSPAVVGSAALALLKIPGAKIKVTVAPKTRKIKINLGSFIY